jgi:hypothetical protein
MAARPKPTNTLRPKPREKKARRRLALQLTRREIGQLKARASADMRSIGGYVVPIRPKKAISCNSKYEFSGLRGSKTTSLSEE